MKIKILLLDNDKYFLNGLRHCLCSYYKHKGIAVEIYSNIIKGSHYQMAFIDEFNFSSFRLANCSIVSDILFLIHDYYNDKMLRDGDNLFLLRRRVSLNELYCLLESAELHVNEIPKKSLATLLTPRELTVLKYYSLGYTNVKIAKLLGIHTKTVSIHTCNIKVKLNFNRKGDFRRWVIMNSKFFSLDEIGPLSPYSES